MVLRIFRAVWFLSVLASLVSLLYSYASIQGDVYLMGGAGDFLTTNRDSFLYLGMILLALVNASVFPVRALLKDENLQSWFHGLVVTVNIFLIISFSYIHLSSSSEKFDYGRIGFIIYGSVGLMAIWAVACCCFSPVPGIAARPRP